MRIKEHKRLRRAALFQTQWTRAARLWSAIAGWKSCAKKRIKKEPPRSFSEDQKNKPKVFATTAPGT